MYASFAQNKARWIVGGIIILTVIIGIFVLLPKKQQPVVPSTNYNALAVTPTNSSVPPIPLDTITKNLPTLPFDQGHPKTETIALHPAIKSNNGMPDNFSGYDQKIDSLNTTGFESSPYFVQKTNPKGIQGVYFVQFMDSVPTLLHLVPGTETIEQVDIKLPANSVKHRLLGKKYFGYISDVDVGLDGKSITVINLETKERIRIPVPDPDMRIASFFMNPDETKIVMAAEVPPTTGDNFATSDTLHHKVWVFDIPKWEGSAKIIFDQKNDVNERWPIFWAKEDNMIYFNNCDVKAFHCNFGITKTSDHSDDRTPVKELEDGKYATQPVLSPDGQHMAYVAWNGNTKTVLYNKGDDANNQFLNKNAIWVYDIKTGEKKMIMDFGDTQIVDYLVWSPDGTQLFYELRQLVENMPTSNSAGIFRINVITREFYRVSPDMTKYPGQLISDLTAVPDGTGMVFSITKLFPKSSFKNPNNKFEKTYYYLRLSDMKMIALGDNIGSVLKTEAL